MILPSNHSFHPGCGGSVTVSLVFLHGHLVLTQRVLHPLVVIRRHRASGRWRCRRLGGVTLTHLVVVLGQQSGALLGVTVKVDALRSVAAAAARLDVLLEHQLVFLLFLSIPGYVYYLHVFVICSVRFVVGLHLLFLCLLVLFVYVCNDVIMLQLVKRVSLRVVVWVHIKSIVEVVECNDVITQRRPALVHTDLVVQRVWKCVEINLTQINIGYNISYSWIA